MTKPCPKCKGRLTRHSQGWCHFYSFDHVAAGKPMCDYSEKAKGGK